MAIEGCCLCRRHKLGTLCGADATLREKGQIEKNAQDARHRLSQPMPNFQSLTALNEWVEARCRELWVQTPHGSQPGAIANVWLEEAQHLSRLPQWLPKASSP